MRKRICKVTILTLLTWIPPIGLHGQEHKKNQTNFSYVSYRIQPGDTLSNIFRRLKVQPIWGVDGYIDKTDKINQKMGNTISKLDQITPQRIIQLPFKKNDSRLQLDTNGFLILKPLSKISKAKKHTSNRKPSGRLPLKRELQVVYDCSRYNDSKAYEMAQKVIDQNRLKYNSISLNFQCSEDYDYGGPYDLKPWMIDLDSESKNSKKTRTPSSLEKNSYFFPSIGYSTIHYTEGSAVDTEFKNVFASLNYRNLLFPPKWHIDAEAKIGVMASKSDVESAEARMLDIDLRIGYSFPLFDEPWRFTLFGGAYYTQMFVTDNQFGYQGTYYPQLYPEIRRVFHSGDVFIGYMKFVPTSREFLSLEENYRSITYGLTYHTDIFEQDVFFNLNYLDFKFRSQEDTADVSIKQYNLGIGVAF